MSQDRTTITRAEAIRRRKEEEQRKRDTLTLKKVAQPKPTPAVKAPTTPRRMDNHSATPVSASRWQRRYDVAMNMPYGQERGASKSKAGGIHISLPHLQSGPRWFSFFIAIACIGVMFLMTNFDTFLVNGAEISGNQRIGNDEIQAVLGINGEPSAFVIPAQIQSNILAAFPDISDAQISINFPNSVVISVTERTPVAAWQQNGQTNWIDAAGFAFKPRGEIAGLPLVLANGAPPTPSPDPNKPANLQAFLPVDLSAAIGLLSSQLPQGAALIFDPQYGLGWSDPNGWKVYFGYTVSDTNQKVKVYQTMLAYLTTKNIKPTMISVEYPGAPFYRVEQ